MIQGLPAKITFLEAARMINHLAAVGRARQPGENGALLTIDGPRASGKSWTAGIIAAKLTELGISNRLINGDNYQFSEEIKDATAKSLPEYDLTITEWLGLGDYLSDLRPTATLALYLKAWFPTRAINLFRRQVLYPFKSPFPTQNQGRPGVRENPLIRFLARPAIYSFDILNELSDGNALPYEYGYIVPFGIFTAYGRPTVEEIRALITGQSEPI
ncbi:hypothetical protein A2625_01705 [candidate division WOR-1 bacterium RIFCSPHIGHO2_01_FULL_53_15]|uniref:Uncharacterized protein n=1 Tax=candidate division WOR-1 bacterium RIFCSPHIGHO2_01_FULL_53_15 TaxID=1802564 RepID=A0A1F4Q287_UNCSA|nr:MAG: hypothetical protein A2625_01705 [candidate division WOR-1 bacterium RIFCSPHIGHO2_01_FULL_53_15]OGC13634.1 MAG: hypothetical protein A3D23_06300 [candidate division WOR-1 bacterium RIFCSPHIGHO2_02_FULL_53_26]